MSSLQRLVITSSGTVADFKSNCPLGMGGLDAANSFVDYLTGVIGGSIQGASLAFKVGAVQAAATITSTGTATAGQTMTLANITLTAVDADPGQNEFVVSATPATQTTNIAAMINASDDLAGIVTAEASQGVVTVTSVVPGLLGNGLQIADVDLGNVAVAAFEGGTDGTAYNIDLD